MDPLVSSLAQELLSNLNAGNDEKRILVGLSGIPASGKSSLAHAIVSKVNEIHQQTSHAEDIAIVVGLDGWHLSRAILASLPNSEEAFARRGAHWTFSGDGYVKFVQALRDIGSPVFAPSFSHATKDPVEEDIKIEPSHRIVLIEGLYVFLSIEPWRVAGELLDERWFVDVNLEDAKTRIVKRHVETGVTSTAELAKERAEQNDFPNGEYVMSHMLEPTKRIQSVNDPSIAI